MKGKVKCALSDRNLSSPPASPVKKKPNAEREKVIAASRRGLEEMEAIPQSKQTGLFKFLKKETDEEKHARELKQKEEAERRAEQREADHVQKARDRVMAADEKREAAAGRKCKERERQYAADVEAGIRNEDFTLAVKKRRIVRHLSCVEYQLISSRLHPRCAMNPLPTILRSCHVRRVRSKTDIRKNIELTALAERKSVNRLSASTRTGSHHSCSARFSGQEYAPNILRKACRRRRLSRTFRRETVKHL
jgi:hypothetical protein